MSQSRSPRSIPVGVLVSVGKRSRRRSMSLTDYPPIAKGANVPLKIGLAFGGAMACLAVAMVVLVLRIPSADAAVPVAEMTAPALVAVQAAPERPAAGEPAAVGAAQPAPAPLGAAPAPLVAAQAPLAALLNRLVAAEPAPPPPAQAPEPALTPCANLGTALSFYTNPPDAFRVARKEKKLVLMVHLSGNFEDQAFT